MNELLNYLINKSLIDRTNFTHHEMDITREVLLGAAPQYNRSTTATYLRGSKRN